MHDHTSSHLFECESLPTSLSSLDLWTNPDKVEPFLATWGGETVGCHMIRVLDSAGSTLVEWGRQQQQQLQMMQCHSLFWCLYAAFVFIPLFITFALLRFHNIDRRNWYRILRLIHYAKTASVRHKKHILSSKLNNINHYSL